MKTDKILIVTGEDPSSVKAIQYGFNLARDLGAKVMLLTVIEPTLAIGNPDAGIFPDDALIDLKAKTEDFLNQVKDTYGTGVDTVLSALVGDIQNTIIETAVKWEADLIIAGTHSRTALDKLLHGDVAESIFHHSPIPVCIVPTHK